MSQPTGQDKKAIRPRRHRAIRIVNTVRVEQAIAFRHLIALAARAHEVKGVPQGSLVQEQFEKPCGQRALPDTIAVCDHDRSPGDAQHFPHNCRWVRDVMQDAEFTHNIETGISERQSFSGSLEHRERLRLARGHPLLHECRDRLRPANQRSRKRCRKVLQPAPRGGAYVQEALNSPRNEGSQ
jgi:hypothetical protein